MDAEFSAVAEALARQGIHLALDGDRAVLDIDGLHARAKLWATEAEYMRAPQAVEGPVLVIGARIAPRLATVIRDNGDWYADARGNAYVSAPGVRVDIRNQRPFEAAQKQATAKNLVSARRSQVIFCFLTWPALLRASVRTVAAAAGVSTFVVHETRHALLDEGYLHPGATRIDRFDELVDRWAGAFPLGLGQDLTLGTFAGTPDPQAWIDEGVPIYVSGEHAVPSIRGTTLTMYAPEILPRALRASRWRRPAPDEEPTVTVRRTFWSAPDTDKTTSPSVAPDLLVYADLLASRDPRQREVASDLREQIRDHGQG